jgi:hypothetical protein
MLDRPDSADYSKEDLALLGQIAVVGVAILAAVNEYRNGSLQKLIGLLPPDTVDARPLENLDHLTFPY